MQPQKHNSTLFDAFETLRGKTFDEVQADQQLLKDMLRLYRYLYDPTACVGCPKEYPTMLAKVMQGEKILTMKTERNFELKPGVSFQIEFGSQTVLHDGTLTDELAIQALKINPNRIVHFASFPDNWKELVGGSESELVKEAPKAELQKADPNKKKIKKNPVK